MPPSPVHPHRHQQLRLPDGRSLGYAEYGDPAGHPIFLFHGMPGSRLTCYPDEAVTAAAGARVITVDRPGYGLSSFQPRRTLLDWPQDITALAAALHLAHYAVTGVSNGAPYALACAYQTPERVSRAGIIAGRGPLDKLGALRELSAEDRNAVRMARGPLWWLMRCGLGL